MNESDPTIQQKTQPPTGTIRFSRQTWATIAAIIICLGALVWSTATNPAPKQKTATAARVGFIASPEFESTKKQLAQAETEAALAKAKADKELAALNQHGGIPGQAIEKDGRMYYPVGDQPREERIDQSKRIGKSTPTLPYLLRAWRIAIGRSQPRLLPRR